MTARWFADRGYDTSLITWDEGQADGESVHGVRVWKTCRPDAGLPGVRFFHPRLTGLYAAMSRANADIYYHNSAEYVTGLAAGWCRRHGRKFVYSAAAELACDVRLPLLRKPHERFFYRRGVKQANLRIVQTERQQELLREGWGLPSVVLPMPAPGPKDSEFEQPVFPHPARVIWVGRVDENKRLDWLLEIAAKLPDVRFEVAAAANNAGSFASRLFERAGQLSNVHCPGAIPRDKMPAFYRGATCLCCTSMHEGFPNTFLEAWSHGIPVVTTFDPGGLVTKLGLGRIGSSVDALAEGIVALAKDEETWRSASNRARAYYAENHEVDLAMSRFEAEFTGLMARPV
jgi:glycosyltransferase involved in cell wall biosynthesis